MKRTKLIGDVFHSVVPEGTAGPWSVGYLGHADNSDFFNLPEFKITAIRNITDQYVPDTTDLIMNDVYIDYSYLSDEGTKSIYNYNIR